MPPPVAVPDTPQGTPQDVALIRGRYRARLAQGDADVQAAQALRWRAFRGGAAAGGAGGAGRDADGFDARCRHLLVEDLATGALAGCLRLMILPDGGAIGQSYSAQFYDLSALSAGRAPMVEIGRFCMRPGLQDADVLRLALAAVTRAVDACGAALLFGCSSFPGTDWQAHAAAFALLRARHLARPERAPRIKAPEVIRFADHPLPAEPPRAALAGLPPLLRSYLAMGGWVSDHAVIDRDLNTLHVFTGVDLAAIPPARARLLRSMAAD